MSLSQYPKAVRRQLRQLAARAYDAEQRVHLLELAQAFKDWEAGSLGGAELDERIHRYHAGPARELFNRYNSRTDDMQVACAIVTGLIPASEVSEEVRTALARPLAFYRMREVEVDSESTVSDPSAPS
jgi:hypothetical protein